MTDDRTKLSLVFNGSNWEDLDRLVAQAEFEFMLDDDYDDNERRRSAYLAKHFVGPALDWAASTLRNNGAALDTFAGFVTAVKEAFGIEANNVTALQRSSLDDLHWSHNVPVFFAEFDRLTLQLGITDHGTKIAMAQAKMPNEVKAELARQSLQFANYDTMRERLNTMWALNPYRHGGRSDPLAKPPKKKSRCGNCGKRGHVSNDCRSSKKD